VPFHETRREDFLQAVQISAFSLVELANALKGQLTRTASVVSIGISSYVTAASYGYMSPIKSALEGCSRFLAKAFSKESEVRFNTVNAGPLKTKSSAGIPGYLENYLFAEKLTLRKRALSTQEVANTAVFLLSPASSGINAQGLTVNAGMDWNYFDEDVVRLAMRSEGKGEA
jgi:enoyl-[acyl-carrier protein] reductase I